MPIMVRGSGGWSGQLHARPRCGHRIGDQEGGEAGGGADKVGVGGYGKDRPRAIGSGGRVSQTRLSFGFPPAHPSGASATGAYRPG